MSTRSFFLIIPAGQTLSNEQDANEDGYRGPMTLTIISPQSFPETVTLQICGTLEDFVEQQSAGADITLPQHKATTVMIASAKRIRLLANGAVAADRIFEVLWNVVTERG